MKNKIKIPYEYKFILLCLVITLFGSLFLFMLNAAIIWGLLYG